MPDNLAPCYCPQDRGRLVPRATRNDHELAMRISVAAALSRGVMQQVLSPSDSQQGVKEVKAPNQPNVVDDSDDDQTHAERAAYNRVRNGILGLQPALDNLESTLASQASAHLVFLGLTRDPLRLHPEHPDNQLALLLEEEISLITTRIASLTSQTDDERLLAPLQEARQWALEIQESWVQSKTAKLQTYQQTKAKDTSAGNVFDTSAYFNPPYKSTPPDVLAACLTAVTCNTLFNASRDLCDHVLFGIDDALGRSGAKPGTGSSQRPNAVPKTLGAAFSKFNVNPTLYYHVLCPKCGARYDYDTKGQFPMTCSNRDHQEAAICGAELGRLVRIGGKVVRRAISFYVRQTIKEWLARMFARPGMEKLMQQTPREAKVKPEVDDIWAGDFVHSFNWTTGGTVGEAPGSELRLVFTMGIDWFGAHHGVSSRKQWSIGAIYLVCMNIPPASRLRPENLCFLAALPKKPPGMQINNLMEPTIDELVAFWTTGVKFSRTTECADGRLVFILLLLLIADLDACRALTGFNHHNSEDFCSYCEITRSTITNVDWATWTKRDPDMQRLKALEWRDASSTERAKITQAWGVRYSVFYKLPYWEPLTQSVPEPMHMINLGLIKRHCRNIWKMDMSVEGGDGSLVEPVVKFTPGELEHAMGLFKAGKSLRSLNKASLFAACHELKQLEQVDPPYTCKRMLAVLQDLQAKQAKAAIKPSAIPQDAMDTTESGNSRARLQAVGRDWWAISLSHEELLVFCRERYTEGDPLIRESMTKLELATWLEEKEPDLGKRSKSSRANTPAPSTDISPEDLAKLKLQVIGKERHNWIKTRKNILYVVAHHEAISAGDTPLPWTSFSREFVAYLQSRYPETEPQSKLKAKSKGRSAATKAKSERTVLGATLLDEIRKDRDMTLMPTGYRKAPREMGSKGNGKLTADQWKVTSTIHMVITLPKVWISMPEGSRFRLLLENFMHLVAASQLAGARVIKKQATQRCLEHMASYLEGMKVLFRSERMVPNHHLAMHIPLDFLEKLGPFPAWSANIFERLNGMLQQIKTNHILGSLETTLITRYSQAAGLRALIADKSLPVGFDGWYEAMEKKIRGRYQGSLDRDIRYLDDNQWSVTFGGSNELTTEEQSALSTVHDRPYSTYTIRSIANRGRKYVTCSEPARFTTEHGKYLTKDSYISYKLSLDTSARGLDATEASDPTNYFGRIDRIVSIRGEAGGKSNDNGRILLLVRPFCYLSGSDVALDPYARWPEVGCGLVYDQFAATLHVIDKAAIIGPLVICPFEDPGTGIASPTLVVLALEIH